jgi:hypothetical protein
MDDATFDARFRSLGGIDPPELLSARTLDAWKRERARSAWITRALAAAGMAAMAAMALLLVQPPDPTATGPVLVQRGVGEALPALELKVAVRTSAGTVRFAPGERYHAGDTLHFRVLAAAPMDLVLQRNEATLWSGPVPAGESDLPIAYALDAGEQAAVFVVSGGPEALRVDVPAVLP